MFKLTLITTTLFLFLGCVQDRTINIIEKAPKILTSENIVNVPIHIRDNGYHNFSTKTFSTQNELNSFLAKIKGQSGWNKKKNFLYTLKKQEIDFNKDSLLIYRFSEPSSSIVIATEVPTEIEKKITVKVGKKSPKIITSDMAYYALAYVVNKNSISVTFDDGDRNKTIAIAIKKP
jgi:hypothetical protein